MIDTKCGQDSGENVPCRENSSAGLQPCCAETDGQEPDFTQMDHGGYPEEIPLEDMKPLTTAQCVGILAAFCIPVLNLILMLIWAYARRGNESRRSMARAGLLLTGILIGALILALGGFILAVSVGWIPLSFSM